MATDALKGVSTTFETVALLLTLPLPLPLTLALPLTRLEAQLAANEQRTAALCHSLETLRRDAGPRCKEGYYAG